MAKVVRDDEQSLYELYVGDDRLGLAHALADVRACGLTVTPLCPSVAAYIRTDPEDADLIAEASAK